MTHVVTGECIKCKYQDCVAVCPVNCFYEGVNMLVIKPDECIDCGVCIPECPANALFADSDPQAKEWLEFNAKYSELWPVITEKGAAPLDADNWKTITNKLKYFDPAPANRD